MIRVAIAEDEQIYREKIRDLMQEYAQSHDLEAEIICYADGKDLTEAFQKQFQIILLDIEMPGRNGLETARRIRETDKNVLIFFITNFAQYAVDGYEVEATGFIVKPVSSSAFARQMDKAIRILSRQQERYLILQNTREIRKVPIREIFYIESVGHYVAVHAQQEDYLFLTTLSAVRQQLPEESFYQINSGTLVHLPYLESVVDCDAVVKGKTLPISRSRKKGLLNRLSEYLSQQI